MASLYSRVRTSGDNQRRRFTSTAGVVILLPRSALDAETERSETSALFPKYPQAFSCKVLPTTRTELSLGRPTRLSVEGEERWELWELRAVPITRSGVFRQAGLRDSTGGAPGVGLRTEG